MQMSQVPVKKRVRWTTYEHILFLHGLQKYGKGDWKRIANECVLSKTPTQVASHAQKYYIQQARKEEDKKRNSIHDITMDKLGQCMVPHHVNKLPIPQTNLGIPPQNHIHLPDVEIQQELNQTQQVLDSKMTNNLPQQMDDYGIHDINPQSTDKYTLLDILDMCPKKKRNHPLNRDLPPQDLTHPLDVKKQQQLQELHQTQQLLDSKMTYNLPQQMGDYEINDINPQSTDKYTLSDILDMCPKKKRNHPLNRDLPPQDLIHPLDVKKQQQLQELHQTQQLLDSKMTYNLPQQMGDYEINDINPQSTDKYTLSDILDMCPKKKRNHPLNRDLPPQDLTHPTDVTKQQQLHELQHALKRYLHYAYPQENLPQQTDWMNPIEEEVQKLPEYQQSQQVCIEELNQCMVLPEVSHHHEKQIASRRVHNFRELLSPPPNFNNY